MFPILDYLSQQRLLLPRLAATYGLHFAIRDLAAHHRGESSAGGESGGDRTGGDGQTGGQTGGAQRREALAGGLKAYASRHAVETIQACREACGGQGYLAANRFAALKADVDVFTTFEGANVVLLQLLAKGLLSEFKEEMQDLKLWGITKHLAARARTRATEMNPVATRRSDEEHLLGPEFHRGALRYREERLLGSVARRLKRFIDEGTDSFEAMNLCQDHLIALARAHVEAVVLDRFLDGAAAAPAPALSETFGIPDEVLRAPAALYGREEGGGS